MSWAGTDATDGASAAPVIVMEESVADTEST